MNDFTILVLPGAYATSVAVTLDSLNAAAAVAPRFKVARPTWRLVSPHGSAVPLSSGLSIEAAPMPMARKTLPDPSTWIVPGLGIESVGDVAERLASKDAQRAIQAVKAHGASGGCVAASCTGVFLLQAAACLRGVKRQRLGGWPPSCAGSSLAVPSTRIGWFAPMAL